MNGQEDPIWQDAKEHQIRDNARGETVFLKTMHTDNHIYFLVKYKDPDKSDQHKSWMWDKDMEAYVPRKQREDVFKFKFAMDQSTQDLSNFADEEYKSDVWYWKAARTNRVGYADDKMHVLSMQPGKKAKKLVSKGGKKMYLRRLSDQGDSAYTSKVYIDKVEEVMPKYVLRTPNGSRADVKTHGVWQDGMWTIVFERKHCTLYSSVNLRWSSGVRKLANSFSAW